MRFLHPHGSAEVTSLPGAADIAVVHAATVVPEERGKGYGRQYNAQRIKHLREAGYEAVMCTVNLNNTPEVTILSRNGWRRVHSYKSRRTGNHVGVYIRTTNEYEDPQS